MNLLCSILQQIISKTEIMVALNNINTPLSNTYRDCCEKVFNKETQVEEIDQFKIESVLDYLHEKLNTGHWSEVPLCTRKSFTSSSFIKV